MTDITTLGVPVTETELIERSQFPRVTKEALEANIKSCAFDYHGLLVKCTLTLNNGFSVSGESACAVPGNYKKDVGERLALSDAKGKIWALMGYELKTKIDIAAKHPTNDADQKTYVGMISAHAKPMSRGAYNIYRGWEIPADENPEDEGFLVHYPSTGHMNWQPKTVFEADFQEFDLRGEGSVGGPTWADRLAIEIEQLEERLEKLMAMIEGPLFGSLPDIQQQLLREQISYMTGYLSVLLARQTA
jgi:hypothetical protein